GPARRRPGGLWWRPPRGCGSPEAVRGSLLLLLLRTRLLGPRDGEVHRQVSEAGGRPGDAEPEQGFQGGHRVSFGRGSACPSARCTRVAGWVRSGGGQSLQPRTRFTAVFSLSCTPPGAGLLGYVISSAASSAAAVLGRSRWIR